MWLSSIGGGINGNTNSRKKKRSSYRSPRSVQVQQQSSSRATARPSSWTCLKLCLLCCGVLVLAWAILVPAMLLEFASSSSSTENHPVGLHALLHESKSARNEYFSNVFEEQGPQLFDKFSHFLRGPPVVVEEEAAASLPSEDEEPNNNNLARGAAGLPLSETPALVGAKRGTIQCDVDVNELVYWNDPQGTRDVAFQSPFSTDEEKFLTFEADEGGWNNIRMSMENIFVLAAATGRTLVLPPKAPFYLLGHGKQGAKSFGNFFEMEKLQQRIKIVTMEEFVRDHGERFLHTPYIDSLLPIARVCVHQATSDESCDILHKLMRTYGKQPDLAGSKHCLVFDEDVFTNNNNNKELLSEETKQRVSRFCGGRTPVYYDKELHEPQWIHWNAAHHDHRLLNHFYSFLYFTNPVIDNYYKRFVRDYLHYTDEIFCAAGKIVKTLLKDHDEFSTLHVRRGDLQYKEVKIPAEEWYENTKEVWKPKEVLYIATDERNKTWFDPLRQHYQLKFLDDYWDMAGLEHMDSSFLGMIDTIVASHGRAFAGTWFSTFTGYINRLRGYNGKSMKDSWYSYLPRKTRMHTWTYPNQNYAAREWPIGWVGIDGDQVVEHERNDDVVTDAVGPPKKEQKESSKKGKKLKESVKTKKKKKKMKQEEKEDTTTTESKALVDGNKRPVAVPKISELADDAGFNEKHRALSRGVAGLPTSETPALEGASRGHIECDVNVDSLAYWNDPQGTRDANFQSPFAIDKGEAKYITFTPDSGGWNNIRMSMEIIFIIAAASGRTLVLPPETPLYLLHADKGKRHRGFADFFPLNTPEFQKRVPTITMEEFVRREGGKDGRLPVPEVNRTKVTKASRNCINMKKSDIFCKYVSDYLESVAHLPKFRAQDYCVIFDKDKYQGGSITPENEAAVAQFCGTRKIAYWDSEFRDATLIHFRAGQKQWRMLTHFYGMLYFTDPAVGNYYNRFVRDFLHYHDAIYCAAGKIVKALQLEGKQRGFSIDDEGGGGYSAMHIRRGDFQYKKVKIPAEEWYENTKEIWKPNEIIFIATDERNKTWFDPIAKYHTIRFLDDYWEMAGLGDLDPNYMGMIDTIVASRARAFAGTWFSTFTGYINRMRGYHGMSMKDSWYSFLERKTAVHTWKNNSDYAYAYEWPTGWVGIDGDVFPSRDKF